MSEMLSAVKRSMHLSGNDMDDELNDDIASALEDMQRVGVTAAVDETDSPLVRRCVEMYVKWQHGYMGEPDRFHKHYQHLRDSLSQGSDYNVED